MADWKEGLPETPGPYLVVQSGVVGIAKFTLNLNKLDEYDFPDEKRPGWYNYDGEWGFYEVHDVSYWMELPRLPGEEEFGSWITYIYRLSFDRNECDHCHRTNDRPTNYCPHCGIKMIGVRLESR